MPLLYLIRHPLTHVDPTRPSAQWDLSEQGRQQVETLNQAAFWKSVRAVYSSQQMKAMGAARLIGERHNIPVVGLPGLAEVRREHQVYRTTSAHRLILEKFFKSPDQVIEGWERADEALDRFVQTTEQLVAQHPGESIAVVSHGTILTLYMASLDKQSPTLSRWLKIGFATVAAVDPDQKCIIAGFSGPPYADIPAETHV